MNCTIRADDDAVVTRLQAPLAGVKRVDLVHRAAAGRSCASRTCLSTREAGEVLVVPVAGAAQELPAHSRMRMRLIAVDEAGERPLGEYTFNHAPQ